MNSELNTTYKEAGWTERLHLEEHAVPEITSCRMPEIVGQYFQSIRANSLSHDELRDDNHWQDLRDLTEETGDENSLRETILNRADQLCKSGLRGVEEREGLKQLQERLWGEKKSQEPETHFLVFGKNLDNVSKCKVLGCLVIEWYPSIECGRFTHLAVDPLFRKQGIGRELIWRGSVVLRDSSVAAGKSLKGIFTWIEGSDEAATESSENPGDTLIRLGAKPIQSDNLTYTLDPKNGLTDTSKFYSFEPDFVDIKAENKISILNELIGKILSK
jgi:GNAT superfamily N-acetyltransferase